MKLHRKIRRQMAAAHGQHLVANQRIALHEHDLGGKMANVHQHRDLIALLRRDEQQRLAQRGRKIAVDVDILLLHAGLHILQESRVRDDKGGHALDHAAP